MTRMIDSSFFRENDIILATQTCASTVDFPRQQAKRGRTEFPASHGAYSVGRGSGRHDTCKQWNIINLKNFQGKLFMLLINYCLGCEDS